MRVLVTGATGLLGTCLVQRLESQNVQVARLTRRPRDPRDIGWNPGAGELDAARLEGFDAVVHLAGESIAGGRWTAERKRRILGSRQLGTDLLARALAACQRRPRTLVSASAVGFYGDRGEAVVDETSPRGEGFLAEVCEAWEAACEPAHDAGIRVVHPRFGAVLALGGGMLGKMLPVFRLGAGGVIGSGDQWLSWIDLDDAVGVVTHALADPNLAGPVNAVAPEAVTNRTFTKTLGRVLRRPTVLPLPAFAARLALGELADELLLASTRVRPAQLENAGYAFRQATLEPALRRLLARP